MSDRARRSGTRSLALAFGLLLLPGCGSGEPQAPSLREGLAPYCAQLHIHQSMSEGEASFLGNVEQARRGGVIDVIWFTDHDWRMALHSYVSEFGFEEGVGPEMKVIPTRAIKPGRESEEVATVWLPVEHEPESPTLASTTATRVGEPVHQGAGALRLTARAQKNDGAFRRHELRFKAPGHRAIRPLATNVRVHLSIFPVGDPGPDSRILVRFLLSEQPPDRRAELDYWLAPRLPEDTEARRSRLLADHLMEFEPGRWNHFTFHLTRDAIADELGGMDNSVGEIRIALEARNGARIAAVFDDLRIEQDLAGEPLMARAWEMARALSSDDLSLYVGQEMSYGAHLNGLGPDVPLLDHARFPHGLLGSETVTFIHDHGGVAILDHMYGVGRKVEGLTGDREAESRMIQQTVDSLLRVNAYGADAIEVGYPLRGGMSLEHHLAAWDRIGMEGVVITGVGTADTHSNRRSWRTGRPNNWTTWIWAASPGMEDLMEGIRTGAAAFGDPTIWDGHMDISIPQGRAMGDVVIASHSPAEITFTCDGLKPGWEARLVNNGAVFETVPLTASEFRATRQIPVEKTSIVRFCVYNETGQAVVCSNPLYFYPSSPQRLLPGARLSGRRPE